MRPALTSVNILRNRGPTTRARLRSQHVFSAKRLLIMVFTGIMLFIPGLALSVAALDHEEEDYKTMAEWKRIMFQAVGPSLCATGAIFMFTSCIYYYCYGSNEEPSPPTNQQSSSADHDEEKGSMRSKSRDHHHHHHHHQSQHHQHHHHPNGRAASNISTPDKETRTHLHNSDDKGRGSKTSAKEKSPDNEEEVPLAQIESISEQGL